jgi:poly-beta-1,6-N-acetyl-D-glucosamine synthase
VEPSILIISPVRNEAAHIERVVRAVAAQELPPARWILRDDHSDDDTLAILRELEPELPFMTVMSAGEEPTAPVRDRLARAAAPRNFNKALAGADWRSHTHVMKLDGDIELAPGYLRELTARFAQDPGLGMACGDLYEIDDDGGRRRLPIPPHHVHGALKCYTAGCFEAIGGLQERLGWDTIDETYARMRGYRTRSFGDITGIHHRHLASADGVLRGRARHGRCAWIAHFTFPWVAMRAVKVGAGRPRVIGGAAFLYGYVHAALAGVERVPDEEFRRFARRELRLRMRRAVSPRRLRYARLGAADATAAR